MLVMLTCAAKSISLKQYSRPKRHVARAVDLSLMWSCALRVHVQMPARQSPHAGFEHVDADDGGTSEEGGMGYDVAYQLCPRSASRSTSFCTIAFALKHPAPP